MGALLKMRHAAVDDKEGLRSNVFAELQVFVIAQAVGGIITPEIPMAGPLGNVPDGLFPAYGIRQLVPLHKATAGKPHKGRVHLYEHLRQVRAQAIGTPLEGVLGEE